MILLGQLDLGLNLAVVQTVLVVAGRLQVAGQQPDLVAGLVDLVAMDCPLGRQNFDLDLAPEDLLPGLAGLVVLVVPSGLVVLVVPSGLVVLVVPSGLVVEEQDY